MLFFLPEAKHGAAGDWKGALRNQVSDLTLPPASWNLSVARTGVVYLILTPWSPHQVTTSLFNRHIYPRPQQSCGIFRAFPSRELRRLEASACQCAIRELRHLGKLWQMVWVPLGCLGDLAVRQEKTAVTFRKTGFSCQVRHRESIKRN